MLKIEFDPSGTAGQRLALCLGLALTEYGTPDALGHDELGRRITAVAADDVKPGDLLAFVEGDTNDEPDVHPGDDLAAATVIDNGDGTQTVDNGSGTTATIAKTPAETPPPPPAAEDTARDTKGVAYDALFCGKSADKPFYASGAMMGQWKKKRGVEQPTYDQWYATQLAAVAPAPADVGTTGTVGDAADPTAAAFTPPAPATAPAPAPAPAAGDVVPADMMSFMKWVAEVVAAGHVTQEGIDAAYAETGLGPHSLMPPATPAEVVAAAAKIHAAIVARFLK